MKNNIGRLLLSSTVGCSLILSGCGGGSGTEKPPAPPAADVYKVGTNPRFDPVISDVPFNTDLVFAAAATSDGTASLGAATDPVRATINQLDGFSTSAFFDILISGSVDPASVLASKSVFLIELNAGGKDALNPANIVGVVGLATYDATVVSQDGGTNNTIRIRPTKPLKSKTKYLVAITSDVKDSSGSALTRSWTYNALRDTTYETLAGLAPVRTAIVGWETLASGFLAAASGGQLSAAAAKDKLVLTYTFTTGDPVTPLIAMAAPRAAIASTQIAAGASPSAAVSNAVTLDSMGLLPTPKKRDLAIAGATGIDFNNFSSALAANVGKLYTGYIKVPYYQTAATGLAFGEYLKRTWKPDLTLAGALGVTVPTDVDGSYNVTYRYPFAAKTGDESIPLQVTLPQDNWVPGYAGAANCGQIYAATGYPTVIYVHGITSDRTSVVALGHTLASRCVATVAIDLPVHGVPANSAFVNALNVEKSKLLPFATLYGANAPHERHFNVAGSGGAPAPMNFETPGTTDGSGAQFINLGFLTNTRDNNRQAVMDLLNLNASLGGINTEIKKSVSTGLDVNRVYVVGVSLGGILGSVFTTVNQIAIANDAQAGLPSNLNPIRGLVTSGAGTQVAQILVNSATFAPIINNGLAASGVNVGTSNYERFLYAAQSAMDSGDPVNFMQPLAQLGVPVLVQQINNDAVIPNGAASAPLAGTSAMASLLNTTQLGLGSTQLGRGYVKHTAGGHSSLLRPEGGALQVTAELQAQVVTFVLNNGGVAVGSGAPGNIELPAN
ncbi:MAG: Ig-like domain-containing protein [Cellvibrio sp.]|uniref:Ig-like domain-containing protein n=1 Tax=Cellvibrio sp. TaxID=1965322 RepID=UPI0031ABD94B